MIISANNCPFNISYPPEDWRCKFGLKVLCSYIVHLGRLEIILA